MSSLRPLLPATLLLTLALPCSAEESIRGAAAARDGITVAIGGVRVRLGGLAPPDDSRCGATSCAEAARGRLAELVQGREITCRKQHRLGHGIWQGRCTLLGGEDPALVLLAEGLAKPTTDARENYRAAAEKARREGVGRFGS